MFKHKCETILTIVAMGNKILIQNSHNNGNNGKNVDSTSFDQKILSFRRKSWISFIIHTHALYSTIILAGNAEQDLFCKIVIGDKSDDIPGIFKKCGPKTAIRYFNDKMAFDKQLKIENAYEKYEKNKKLVDFNEIPEDLVLEFMVNLNI